AFWLVACAFGPFFGWLVTAIPPTLTTWKWQYLGRASLAVLLPVITAVPLVPYARGKAALIAIPLLLVITALPILSCVWVLGDLQQGPEMVVVDIYRRPPAFQFQCVSRTVSAITCDDIHPAFAGAPIAVTWLPHTKHVLSQGRLM